MSILEEMAGVSVVTGYIFSGEDDFEYDKNKSLFEVMENIAEAIIAGEIKEPFTLYTYLKRQNGIEFYWVAQIEGQGVD